MIGFLSARGCRRWRVNVVHSRESRSRCWLLFVDPWKRSTRPSCRGWTNRWHRWRKTQKWINSRQIKGDAVIKRVIMVLSVVTGEPEDGAAAWQGCSAGKERGWQAPGDAGRKGARLQQSHCWAGPAAQTLGPGAGSRVPACAALSGAEWSHTKSCAAACLV